MRFLFFLLVSAPAHRDRRGLIGVFPSFFITWLFLARVRFFTFFTLPSQVFPMIWQGLALLLPF